MEKLLFAVVAVISLVCSAQTSNETKTSVDALKSSIPYPKYNIGDTLFIAFIMTRRLLLMPLVLLM